MNRSVEQYLAPILHRYSLSDASYTIDRLEHAYASAKHYYGDAMHWTGETVLEHVLGVLERIALFEPDEDTVIACLLHHVLDQKAATLLQVEEQFGPKVRELVGNIHLLSHVTLQGRRHSIEDLRVMLLSVSDDIRVILVSLCDRDLCLSHLHAMDADVARKISQDVLQLFAPVAARLGIYSLKHRLENAAFPVLYPEDYGKVMEQLENLRKNFPHSIEHASTVLQNVLHEHQIDARFDARQKMPYSIFRKMHRKSFTHIEDVHDLFALRVIVGTEEDCYRALGAFHRIGRPVSNRFKDYIAFPKPNGYQSLHTTLTHIAHLPDQFFIEVQIRTEDMHREAEFGIAAHWSYKELGATARAVEKVQLHNLLMKQESVDHDDSTGPSFVDHIFVLTPKGDIVELPEGATPLDFAFQVHTDVGLSFRHAKVNGSIVSLDYMLENGDVVEIVKHAHPHPSPQWINMMKMASSRSKLRRYLYALDRPRLVAAGREMLNVELRKRGHSPLTTDLSVLRICDGKVLTMQQREDVLMKIGQGAEKVGSLFSRLAHFQEQGSLQEHPEDTVQTFDLPSQQILQVYVEGNLSLPVRYAKCCSPDQHVGTPIVGNISREGQVMIHRSECRMYAQTNPERRVHVWWEDQ